MSTALMTAPPEEATVTAPEIGTVTGIKSVDVHGIKVNLPQQDWGLERLGEFVLHIGKRMAIDIWRLGMALEYARAKCPNKKWGEWQEKYFPGLPNTTKDRYRRLAQKCPDPLLLEGLTPQDAYMTYAVNESKKGSSAKATKEAPTKTETPKVASTVVAPAVVVTPKATPAPVVVEPKVTTEKTTAVPVEIVKEVSVEVVEDVIDDSSHFEKEKIEEEANQPTALDNELEIGFDLLQRALKQNKKIQANNYDEKLSTLIITQEALLNDLLNWFEKF